MGKSRSKRAGIALVITVVAFASLIGGLLASGGQQSAPRLGAAPAALVLDSRYARSVGFPETVQAASKQAVTSEKGCSTSIEAVYEDTPRKTGLISELLKCNSQASAAKVLANFRKSIHVASSIGIPAQLGTTAFATASSAPEYVVAWQVGSGVALTAVDVNIAASSSTSEASSGSATSKSITRYQVKVLTDAAVQQNSLYH
jgi:hypothetical protein